MRIVFVLGDGRTIEVPSEQVQLTCPDAHCLAVSVDGQRVALINEPYPFSIRAVQDDSVKWCEDLWKLEDRR